jgi:hypothetical protein
MALHPPPAGTIASKEPGREGVLSPAPTASRESNSADINDDTCLRYKHRPPLNHGQAQ